MTIRAWLAGAAFAVLAAGAGTAEAGTYQLTYTTFADSLFPAINFDALLTTGGGEFPGDTGVQILSISGTRNGVAISGLADPYSEVYPAQAPLVDNFGVTFTAGNYTYNLYNDGSNSGLSYHEFATLTADPSAPGEGRLIADRSISLKAVSAAPEPSAWALMIVGVGLAGAALRTSRRRERAFAKA